MPEWSPRSQVPPARERGVPAVVRGAQRRFYPYLTHFVDDDVVAVLNDGYEEDPPMGLKLDAADEPERYPMILWTWPDGHSEEMRSND